MRKIRRAACFLNIWYTKLNILYTTASLNQRPSLLLGFLEKVKIGALFRT
jgi:hypothetical protein